MKDSVVVKPEPNDSIVQEISSERDTDTPPLDVEPLQPAENAAQSDVATTVTKSHPPPRLNISQKVLEHLETLPEFPKIVHYVWMNKTVVNATHIAMVEHGVRRMIDINPEWQVIVHEYADIDRVIQNFQHKELSESMRRDILGGHLVERTDTFRFMTLYSVGGLYIDIDRVVSKPLNQVIDVKRNKLVIPTYYNINFAMDLVGSAPGNKLILNVLRESWKKRIGPPVLPRKNGWLKKWDQMKIVDSYTQTMEMQLFGSWIKDEELYADARRAILEQSKGLILTAKEEWCEGLVVHNYDGCRGVSRNPFYEYYNISRWGDAVDAVWGDDLEPTK